MSEQGGLSKLGGSEDLTSSSPVGNSRTVSYAEKCRFKKSLKYTLFVWTKIQKFQGFLYVFGNGMTFLRVFVWSLETASKFAETLKNAY